VLAERLRGSDVTVVIVSPEAMRSQFVFTEAGAAMAYAQTSQRMIVIPVVLGDAEIPPALSNLQAIFSRDRDAESVAITVAAAVEASHGRRIAEEEVRKEVHARVAKTAADYVNESISSLEKRATADRRLSHLWYGLGFACLVSGVGYGLWRVHILLSESPETFGWTKFAALTLLSIVVISLLIALSRYAFMLGKAFMAEALRNADRMHAISFGRFYLNAFAEAADWAQVKEAFQHWNIDRGSTFLAQEISQFDPKLLETAVEIAKVLAAAKNEKPGAEPPK
jgi:hypothetical protein